MCGGPVSDEKTGEQNLETLDKLIVGENYFPELQYGLNLSFWKLILQGIFAYNGAKLLLSFPVLKGWLNLLRGSVTNYKLKPFVM